MEGWYEFNEVNHYLFLSKGGIIKSRCGEITRSSFPNTRNKNFRPNKQLTCRRCFVKEVLNDHNLSNIDSKFELPRRYYSGNN